MRRKQGGYQFKALIYKNARLQSRQKKVNFCQIVYPAMSVITVGVINIMCMMAMKGQPPVSDSASKVTFFSPIANATYPCLVNGTSSTCGFWNDIYFSAPNNVSAIGALNGNGTAASGLLGHIPQKPFNDNSSEQATMVPFFEAYSSPNDIDEALLSASAAVDPSDSTPTTYGASAAVNFFTWEQQPNGADVKFDYQIQVTNQQQLDTTKAISQPQDEASLIMQWVDGALMAVVLQNPLITLSVSAMSMSGYCEDYGLADMMPAIMTFFYVPLALGWILPIFIFSLVEDKQKRIVIMMKIMGMNPLKYLVAQYAFYLALYLIMATFISVSLLVFLIDVFWHSNPLSWITLFVLFGFSLVSLSFFCASLFNSSRNARIFAYILCMFAYSFMGDTVLWVWPQTNITSIGYLVTLIAFPPFTVVRGLYLVCLPFCDPTVGPMDWNQLYNFGSPIWVCYWALITQAVAFFFASIYIDSIKSNTYNISILENLSPAVWCRIIKRAIIARRRTSSTDDLELAGAGSFVGEDGVEQESEDCSAERRAAHVEDSDAKIRVVDLKKTYDSGSKQTLALDELCLTVRNGECLGLLGVNGAGKSTLISILVGLTRPSSGYAYVNGYHIPDELSGVYQSLGFCPQFDILWDEMTVKEHLIFYCRLKGVDNEMEGQAADALIGKMRLYNSGNKLVNELSGGMKRRLSLAISLVGDPAVLLLDEPTTGLDPVNRRTVWDAILEQRDGRATILVSHSMEEASTLTSRIAIMDNGRLQCIGTQDQLKRRYGDGFKITINNADEARVMPMVLELDSKASVCAQTAHTITYRVSGEHFDLVELLCAVERFGLEEWSVSQTSLEEVFLQIVRDHESTDEAAT